MVTGCKRNVKRFYTDDYLANHPLFFLIPNEPPQNSQEHLLNKSIPCGTRSLRWGALPGKGLSSSWNFLHCSWNWRPHTIPRAHTEPHTPQRQGIGRQVRLTLAPPACGPCWACRPQPLVRQHCAGSTPEHEHATVKKPPSGGFFWSYGTADSIYSERNCREFHLE